MSPQIVLTGVTGNLASLVLKYLRTQLPPSSIGISTRDPSKLAHLSAQGHRVRQGSYDDPVALAHSFKGAHSVLIVSSNLMGGGTQDQHRNAIEAAKSARVKRIFYTSHQGASATSPFAPCRDHFATEKLMEDSGLEYVSLRNGFYMNVIDMLIASIPYTRTISAPKDGPVSWTDRDNLAKAIAKLMTTESVPKIVTLVNPDALDLVDIGKIYAEVKGGGDVKRATEEADAYVAGLVKKGIPSERAEMMRGMFATASQGGFKSDDPTLGKLLDGKLTSVKDMLAATPAK